MVGARFADRIGKGLRGAPRDALVADVTPKETLGTAFGVRQSMDAAGAFVGPLLATILLFYFAEDFRTIFLDRANFGTDVFGAHSLRDS